ncbi:MAG TPA: LCP family protein [Ktedonobacteraceae bacterium]|nr:LCP family protein [Ktedonobacteraceae bacterium]
MNNNPFYPDEPPRPQSSSSQSDQPDKLVLGPQGSRRVPGRQPYQNPSQPPQPEPPYQQRPNANQQRPASANLNFAAGASWQGGNAPAQQYPNQQPGQMGSQPPALPGKKPRSRRKKGCLIGCLSVLVLFIILLAILIPIGSRVLAFGSAISTQAPLSSQTGYVGGSNRINLLIMGYGGAGHDGAYLTDSMEVISMIPSSHHTTLISVPRDLWVQIPPNSGQYAKLNYAYVYGSNNGANPVGGGTMATQKISTITGLDVKYWATINFAGFENFINAIGGVDVCVPDSFASLYPANDNPSINASWITIHFTKGCQHMDGKTAIEYSRARETINNPAEGSDFARSKRQQLVMQAALSKLRSISNWPSLYNALDSLQKAVYTNMSLADLGFFAMKMDLKDAHRADLTNNNVLTDAVSSDGQDILLPVNNNWQAVIDYIKQNLYN